MQEEAESNQAYITKYRTSTQNIRIALHQQTTKNNILQLQKDYSLLDNKLKYLHSLTSPSAMEEMSNQLFDLMHQNHEIHEEIDKIENEIHISKQQEQMYKKSNSYLSLQSVREEIHQLHSRLRKQYAKYTSLKQQLAHQNAGEIEEETGVYADAEIRKLKNDYQEAKREFNDTVIDYEQIKRSQIAEVTSLKEQIEAAKKPKQHPKPPKPANNNTKNKRHPRLIPVHKHKEEPKAE